MAFVGISSNLLKRVKHKINTMQQAELRTIGDAPKITLPPDNPTLLRALWGEHLHLKDIIPKEWKCTTDAVRSRFLIRFSENQTKGFSFNLAVNPAVETPTTYSYYHTTEFDGTAPELKDIYDYASRHVDITVRWESVLAKVTQYLESCKSLNEAVKTWPDVALYIDKEDLDRLEVKREKKVKESAATEALAKLNVDELVGAAVIARMSGAV